MAIDSPMDRPGSQANLSQYAAETAPLVDRVHASFHQRAAAAFRECGLERPPHTGILISLRFVLVHRPLPMAAVRLAFRYSAPEDVAAAVAELAAAGWLCVDGELVHPAQRTVAWTRALYDVHAEVATAGWAPATTDLTTLAALAGQLLAAAAETGGAAFAALHPPFERAGDPPGLLLFNRLAVLRYHRADAHAVAWGAEGLTAQAVQALEPGSLRDRIEAETNRLAAPPFAALTTADRQVVLTGLGALAAAP